MTTLLDPFARQSENSAVLQAIADPSCSLAVWERAPFADFAPLVAGDTDDLRFAATPGTVADKLLAELAQSGFAGGAALHRVLADDAARLARLFCAAMDLETFELRLEVVRSDSCRKFHADYVTARLITTYLGEGTHWLSPADAARVAAGAEPKHIGRLAPFDVGLFKGRLASETPAIHRSPPIAGSSGGVRLLLVLNPVSRRFVDGAESGEDCPLPPPPQLA